MSCCSYAAAGCGRKKTRTGFPLRVICVSLPDSVYSDDATSPARVAGLHFFIILRL
jgi:hypothetical protein